MRFDGAAWIEEDAGTTALSETCIDRLTDADAEVVLIAETASKIAIANLVKRCGKGHTC